MVKIFYLAFAIGLVVMLPAYALYFSALGKFTKSLRDKHPEIYARFAGGYAESMTGGYAALEALRADSELASKLDPSVAGELREAYRYLVIGAAAFMVVLFAFLGNSLVAKA